MARAFSCLLRERPPEPHAVSDDKAKHGRAGRAVGITIPGLRSTPQNRPGRLFRRSAARRPRPWDGRRPRPWNGRRPRPWGVLDGRCWMVARALEGRAVVVGVPPPPCGRDQDIVEGVPSFHRRNSSSIGETGWLGIACDSCPVFFTLVPNRSAETKQTANQANRQPRRRKRSSSQPRPCLAGV